MPIVLTLCPAHLDLLRRHLFDGEAEQAAFAFAEWDPAGVFAASAIELVPAEGFTFQSEYHIELSSSTQARVIKQGFDRRACLVEFHSHRSRRPARFSGSDFSGFAEFVPHVRWRLERRPYLAVVFHETSIDGLAWIEDAPIQLDRLEAGATSLVATGLSAHAAEDADD